MKRMGLLIALLILAAALSGCGGNDDASAQNAAGERASAGAQAEATVVETPLLTGEEVAAQIGAQGDLAAGPAKAAGASAELTSAGAEEERPVDLDLTQISGTVVYSQVFDMMAAPENYMGWKIRLKGSFSYYQDPDTKQEYFAAVIADATACCAQGIEFAWQGEHAYPQDYPPLDTEITVTGTFGTYYEGDNTYVQLADAQVEWDA